jgi:hypothetical protein
VKMNHQVIDAGFRLLNLVHRSILRLTGSRLGALRRQSLENCHIGSKLASRVITVRCAALRTALGAHARSG